MNTAGDTLGQRVRKLRESQRLSLSDLAHAAKISRSYLYQIETGGSSPTQEKLEALATALGVTVPDLLGFTVESPPIPDSLAEFRDRYRVPDAEIRMLASIQYRGRRPETVTEWRRLYNIIRATLEDEEA